MCACYLCLCFLTFPLRSVLSKNNICERVLNMYTIHRLRYIIRNGAFIIITIHCTLPSSPPHINPVGSRIYTVAWYYKRFKSNSPEREKVKSECAVENFTLHIMYEL